MTTTEQTQTVTVAGMTCGGCLRKVRGAISDVQGVTGVDVHVKSGQVTITSESGVDLAIVATAVDEAGYEVVT